MNRRLAWIIALLSGTAIAQEAPKDEGVFEPGVQHVCVPTSDGEGWDCGTASAPPENYREPVADTASVASTETSRATEPATEVAAPADNEETPPPPVFLADPDRLTPYAPIVDEPADEPVAEAAPVTAAEPVAEPVAAPEPAATVIEAPAAPAVAAPAAPDAQPTPVVAAPTPTPASNIAMSDLGTADTFAQLPATSFTLQLAYAASAADFPRLVAALRLDPASCYVLRVRGSNGMTWLLAHGAFADAATARAAQASLPNVAGLVAQWPRRIGALQTERAAQER